MSYNDIFFNLNASFLYIYKLIICCCGE